MDDEIKYIWLVFSVDNDAFCRVMAAVAMFQKSIQRGNASLLLGNLYHVLPCYNVFARPMVYQCAAL